MTAGTHYGVPTTKGPVVKLKPHPAACDTVDELEALVDGIDTPLAADLFCGAGGFSLGLGRAGFTTVVGVDFDHYALETYRHLFSGMVLERDLSDEDAIAEISDILKGISVTAIIGGPPCQPFSTAGLAMIQKLVEAGARDAYDHRRDLWQSFLEIVARVRPPVVLMENVPEFALSDESIILRLMTGDLERLGYSVHVRLVDAWRYGVPQHRRRLILVAVHGRRLFHWPLETLGIVTVRNAIADLPEVSGGWNEAGGPEGFLAYDGPTNDFQRRAREGVESGESSRIYDHITRPVRGDDKLAFAQMDSSTSYSDLDESLKRYREDIFDDKYKRLDPDDVGRTIIAHIAKDGYGFIHPTQDRTITVREVARLQTFPDRVRFAGPPTAAFRQIGNAVPPLLAERIGEALWEAIEGPEGSGSQTAETSSLLARWYQEHGPASQPWLAAESPWAVLVGDSLLMGVEMSRVRSIWPLLAPLDTPEKLLDATSTVTAIGRRIGRQDAADNLLVLARHFEGRDDSLNDPEILLDAPDVASTSARLVALADAEGNVDVLFSRRGVLRVVARFSGTTVDRVNQRSDGRVEVARMVGAGEDGRLANLAIVELARSVCDPADPECPECPLVSSCVFAAETGRDMQGQMFQVLPAE